MLKAYAGGELVGTGAAEHDELRLVHRGFRQRDGIFCCRNASDGSGTHALAFHDGGVEVVFAVGGEDSALAGVEERIVLEDVQAGFDSVDCGAIGCEDLGGGVNGVVETGVIGGVALGRHGGALYHARSAMHDHGPLACGRVSDERGGLLRDGEGHRSETECQCKRVLQYSVHGFLVRRV